MKGGLKGIMAPVGAGGFIYVDAQPIEEPAEELDEGNNALETQGGQG